MFVSLLIGVGLLLGLAALSLLSGAINFLFVKPRLKILKSTLGPNGFAFAVSWDQSAEPVKYDHVRIQLFNPFGNPTQREVTREFAGSEDDFARDLDLGIAFNEIKSAKGIEKATVEITVSASKVSVFQTISMNGAEFLAKLNDSFETAEDFNKKHEPLKKKSTYKIPERSFISPPLPKSGKALKLATNPEFAGSFAGGATDAGSGATAAVSFSVSKVWIEPGCIVCNACEGIIPEVFEVTDTTCLIRPGAPLNEGLRIQEAAEACPVEVIKFIKIA
jgi:ferredoxin